MKTSLEIINKMSEQEAVKLESQKVELNLATDLENESKKFTAYYSQLSKIINDFNAKGKEITALSQKIAMESQSAQKVIANYEAQVKDLGLTIPPKVEIQKTSIKNLEKMANKLRLKPLTLSTSPGSY
jgi:hypothetical protein